MPIGRLAPLSTSRSWGRLRPLLLPFRHGGGSGTGPAAWGGAAGGNKRRFTTQAAELVRRSLQPNYFVHAGNVLLLVAINQSDMLNLRVLSISASLCGILYNLLQPRPLIPPACWGVFFVGCHIYQLSVLLRERAHISLGEDEEKAYNMAFLPFGITPRTFLDILEKASARWCHLDEGQFASKRGDLMDDVHYLVEGEVEVLSATDDKFLRLLPGKGGWLGEFFDPNQKDDYWEVEHRFPVSHKCVSPSGCRTLAFNRKALHDTLAQNPRLGCTATKAVVSDLWGKLHRSLPEARRNTYKAMLELALSDGKLDERELKLLGDFKKRHRISDEEHEAFLAELGVAPEAFKSKP